MTELHFKDIARELEQLIANAQRSIRVASAYYTSEKLTSALCAASSRGIDVQLIVDYSFMNRLVKYGGIFKKREKFNFLQGIALTRSPSGFLS